MHNAVALHPRAHPRNAAVGDVDGIYRLLEDHIQSGVLLPRSKANITDELMKFTVIEHQQKIAACGSLEIFNDNLCEVRSLVVDPGVKYSGFGRQIVETLIDNAMDLGLQRIMALTYVPEFFHKLGFMTVPKSIFPEKVWGVCVKCHKFEDCDEIAVLKILR